MRHTFMAVEPGDNPKVYPNVIEFEAVAAQGGTLSRTASGAPSRAAPPARRRSASSSRMGCSAPRSDATRAFE